MYASPQYINIISIGQKLMCTISQEKVYKTLLQRLTFNYLLSPRINTLAQPSRETGCCFLLPPDRCASQQTHVPVFYDGPYVKKIVGKDQLLCIAICLAALYRPAQRLDGLAAQL